MNTDKLKESLAGLDQLEREYHQTRNKAYKALLEECYDLKNPKELVTALYCHKEIPEQVKLEVMWENEMLPFKIGDSAIIHHGSNTYLAKCNEVCRVYTNMNSGHELWSNLPTYTLTLVYHIVFYIEQIDDPYLSVEFKMNKWGRWLWINNSKDWRIEGFANAYGYNESFDVVNTTGEDFKAHHKDIFGW